MATYTTANTAQNNTFSKIVIGGAVAATAWVAYNSITSTLNGKSASSNQCKYIYIAGDRSAVGKSSICAALIQSFIDNKILSASEIGYIKPQTQCISATHVARYCLTNGIECAPIGPIVFKKGYTSQVIDGKHGSRAHRLNLIKTGIERVSKGKKLVVIDGVGYVSVGSVTRTDNVDVAKLMNAYTILIVRSGIGDSIDTTNLLLAYYQSKYPMERLLGVIYNFKEQNSSHRLESCKLYVSKYFKENRASLKLLGWIPPLDKEDINVPDEVVSCMRNNNPQNIDWKSWPKLHPTEIEWLTAFAKNFQQHIDFEYILSKLKI